MKFMNILLIESDRLELTWLKSYMGRYDTDGRVEGRKSIQEAIKLLEEPNNYNIILLDPDTYDALSPGSLTKLVEAAQGLPIVVLVTGKTMLYECIRQGGTRIYHLKTDVSEITFLTHLKNIIVETEIEKVTKVP